MKIAMIGFGKMGGNMAERLRRAGHDVVGYDRDPAQADVGSLAEAVAALDGEPRRIVWVMVPAVHNGVEYAQDSVEGRWTIGAAIDHAVPVPAISAALFARFASRQDDSPAMNVIATLRNQFGGHDVHSS